MANNSVHILLIEDNPIHARMIQTLLAEDGQPVCELDLADRLSAGLAHLKAGGVDLVLLDLVLPDSQEMETYVQVRAAVPEVPIVILTGLDDVKLAAKAVEAGAQDYLLKSQLNSVSLRRSIRYTLERTRAGSAEWDAPMFRLAQQQFLKAAQIINLDDNIRHACCFPSAPRWCRSRFDETTATKWKRSSDTGSSMC